MNIEKKIISSLINIDSSFRELYPKHIYGSTAQKLSNNPITFVKDSDIITIKHNNHNFIKNDNIIIQNVIGDTYILNESMFLLNDVKYAVIILDNNIDINYKKYNTELYINIELIYNQDVPNFIDNIPFNSILGIKKCYIYDDLNFNNLSLLKLCKDKLNIDNITDIDNIKIINKSMIFIDVFIPYLNTMNYYYTIDKVVKISYFHINGIKIGYINANYPINNFNYQSSQLITNIIDNNYYQIKINNKSYNDNIGGGNNIIVNKIDNSIEGYPNSDNYVINLKKTFNNVTKIELISMEIPFTDILIKKNINDKLYWKNIEDSNYIYSIQLDEGFYVIDTLINELKNKINNTQRKGYINNNKIYNIFDISINKISHIITFKSYNKTNLPNSLSIRIDNINNEEYYILNVNHPYNILNIDDYVTIYDSSDLSINNTDNTNITDQLSINSTYINKEHQIFNINITNQTYDILLGKTNNINTQLSKNILSGGKNIYIQFKTRISLLFDKSDTIGDILGFRNIGTALSITDFKYEITNKDQFIESNNVDTVGNDISYFNGFINLTGKYNYILMYLNDIEYIYNNNNISSSFTKILLNGNPGEILFNSFIEHPVDLYSKSFPINTLTELRVYFLYPDGNRVEFRNINHSFTLKISEEKLLND